MAMVKKHWLLIAIVAGLYWWWTHKQMITQPSVRQETITAPAPGVKNFTEAFNEDIGFPTLSIAVDNFTGYWLYLPGAANPYIPPFWVGVVRNVIHATTRQPVQWASPFTATQTPLIPGSFVNVTFTNYILPYAPGSLAGTPPDPIGPPVGPPPINITFDPTILIDGICDCIGGGGVVAHGVKLTYDTPNLSIPIQTWVTYPLPVAVYDTDGYSDGIGATIPAGRGGWYQVGTGFSIAEPLNAQFWFRLIQDPPTIEPIGIPPIGDILFDNGFNPEDLLRNGPFPTGPIYLPVGTTVILQVNMAVGAQPTQVVLWLEQMVDRTATFPVYSLLAFPGVAGGSGIGNTIGTFATVVASSTVTVDWQEVGGTPTMSDGVALFSPTLGFGPIDSGGSAQTAPAVHYFLGVPAAPDWEIIVVPNTAVFEPGITGSGRYKVTIP